MATKPMEIAHETTFVDGRLSCSCGWKSPRYFKTVGGVEHVAKRHIKIATAGAKRRIARI